MKTLSRLAVLSFVVLGLLPSSARAGGPGDGGRPEAAVLDWPSGVAIDLKGNLYVAERRGNRVRRIDAQTGVVTAWVG